MATNFPRKGLRSKRRSSPCIFQVVASLSISSFLVILAADIRIRALACNTLKVAYGRKKFAHFSHFARPIKIFSLLNLGNCCRQGEGGGGNKFRKAKHFWPHYIFLAFQFTSPIFLLHLHLKCATVMFKIFPTSIFLGGGNYPTPSSLISDGHLSTIFRLE